MFREVNVRRAAAVLVAALVWVGPLAAQAVQGKDSPKQDGKPAALKIVDINSASQTEIAGVGIDSSVAKKIVDARPFRTKRDLVTRHLITEDQYDKIKDMIIARRAVRK